MGLFFSFVHTQIILGGRLQSLVIEYNTITK